MIITAVLAVELLSLQSAVQATNQCNSPVPGAYYYKSCQEIKTSRPESLSGEYLIQPERDGDVIWVYCEMALYGGGFTFIPRTAIRGNESEKVIKVLFTNRSEVLMRIQKRDGTQPYSLVTQLQQYKQHLFSAFVNKFKGYAAPMNAQLGDYLYLGILPTDVAGVDQGLLGFQSNGIPLLYKNCGGNKNNYFTFFPNHSEKPPQPGDSTYERSGLAVNWRSQALRMPSGRTMTNEFFFLTELHMGGCGAYTSSDRWTDALGTAVGFR